MNPKISFISLDAPIISKILRYISTLAITLSLVQCGIQQKGQTNEEQLIKTTPEEFLDNFSLAQSESTPWQSSGSLSLVSQDFAIDIRVDASIYPKNGIFLSLRPLPFFEIARIYILPENIIIIDKSNKQYFSSSYEEFNRISPIPLSYNLLESLILGQAPQNYEEMQLHSSGRIRVSLPNSPLQLTYQLNDLFRAKNIYTNPLEKGYAIYFQYATYSERSSYALPRSIKMTLSRKQNIVLQLDYNNRSLQRKASALQRLTPKIPSSYTELNAYYLERLLQNLFH